MLRWHVLDHGPGSVVFKGQSVRLARGMGEDGNGNVGPHAASYRSADVCVLKLPVVASWQLEAPFTSHELRNGHWNLHYVKGFYTHVTTGTIGRSFVSKELFGDELQDVLNLEVNWHYGG